MTRRRRNAFVTAAIGSAAALAFTVASIGAPVAARPRTSTPDPTSFVAPVSNPYYPLIPGSVAVLRGVRDGERVVVHTTVTNRTKTVQGVSTTVVRDVLKTAGGRLVEKTDDWYANDDQGNVWYFGEATATYDASGTVISTDGSWEAGVDGAVAGIIMPVDPKPTDAYRQEFYQGHAEDQAWIVQRGLALTVPYGAFQHLLRSMEWTRIEASVVTEKLYAPGFGIVMESDLSGGDEHLELVRYTPGS